MSFEKDIKILVVGSGKYSFYEVALYDAFCRIGYNAEIFTWEGMFTSKREFFLSKLIKRIEHRINFGLIYLRKININLILQCKKQKPDVVFFYNTRIFSNRTIDRIKNMGIKIVAFSNDDPFSQVYPKYWWKKYLYIAKKADLVYAFRKVNVKEYEKMGCKNVRLFLSYYIEERNKLIPEKEKLLYVPSVVYVGHIENDGRIECIRALLDAGIKVGIKEDEAACFGQHQNIVALKDTHKNYNKILASAKIALLFYSKRNRDEYTTRSFEIPAAGTMMMSIYTDTMAELFSPDSQAIYFKNPQELVEKCKKYLANDTLREKIAKAGYDRLIKDGHEIKDRAEQIMKDIKKLF